MFEGFERKVVPVDGLGIACAVVRVGLSAVYFAKP